MSCDYDLVCTDCNDHLGLADWNHADGECRSLIANAHTIAGAFVALRGTDIEMSHYRGRVDWSWFVKHAGHKMRVIDEYGRFDDTCDVHSKCDCCGHVFSCKLTSGHEGANGSVCGGHRSTR